jgi:hypothetical protein
LANRSGPTILVERGLRSTSQDLPQHGDVFERFLTDRRIEIDSNIVERAIRPQAIIRKNSLFAGSDGGGRTWVTIATPLQTAKMNTVIPRLGLPKR